MTENEQAQFIKFDQKEMFMFVLKKLDKMDDKNDKKFSSIDDKINSKFKEMQDNVNNLTQEISNVKQDINIIKIDLATVETNVKDAWKYAIWSVGAATLFLTILGTVLKFCV
ncbi:MAG: hypothetical protein LBT37_00770 [Lactobacillaceae bacterium]|jgi:septal ring factor EnvC (AmiA/AmiB activator)|nr:hypothetical protein [Lactobacillaceae bacterium]